MTRDRSLLVAAAVLLLVGLVAILAARPAAPVAVTPPATASASPSDSPTAAASPALPPGTFENRLLGYRVTLPVPYRLESTSINAGQPEQLGNQSFTVTSVAEQQAACVAEVSGGIGGAIKGERVEVAVFANVRGQSVVPWAAGSAWASLHTVEPVTVGGYEAARLVQRGFVHTYVISANNRMYVLSHLNESSPQRLAEIAASFQGIPPLPFPTAPPPQIARDAATNLGQRLAQAFAAKDATAVAGLMTDCRIGAGAANIGSEGLSRSSAAFIAALRDRFAKGDLTVTVNPELQVKPVSGEFFVRSEWKEPDRTIPMDLLFRELDGRWQWTGSIHYYPSLVGSGCIPYRSPWVPVSSPGSTC